MRFRFVRTSAMPWGVRVRSEFSENDHRALKTRNALMRSTLRLLRCFNKYQIPRFLENPYSCMMWKLPALPNIAISQRSSQVTVDFCSYGTAWRKRTHCLFGNTPERCLLPLRDHLCCGRGTCSFTNKPRIELSGPLPTRRIPWAKVAEPYPKDLCRDLAIALISATIEREKPHT